MNIVLCETAGKQKYNAGSKARQDVLQIAKGNGYRHITLFHNGRNKAVVLLEMAAGLIKAIFQAGRDDIVLIQYPYSPDLLNKLLVGALKVGKKCKGYRLHVLLHDVNALRSKTWMEGQGAGALERELRCFRGVDAVICHNEAMREVCAQVLPQPTLAVLGPFDYLYDGPICQRQYSEEPVVMVAGNLSKEKCGYIYDLDSLAPVRFDLYGASYEGENQENIRYRGKFSPEELIGHLDGQFGLVWDGDSIKTCGGENGNYLRYNNPHKLSLYIAAGVPVIVWKESALAGYVEENDLGICIGSLSELQELFSEQTEETYMNMVMNVIRIRDGVIKGENLKRALMMPEKLSERKS